MRYRTMVTVLLVCCLLNLIGVVFTIRFMDEQDQTIRDQKALLKKSDQLISSQKNLITVREEQLEKYGQIKKDLEKTVDRYAVVIKTQEKTIAANEETIATAQKIHEIAMKIQVAQEEKIKSFINSQENLFVFKVYSDAGFSGASLERPALVEMLRDIQENKINVVIVYKIDRLTRSPKDFYALMEIFEQHEVDFISITERFDTSTPSGRLLRNIMLTFAQFERELTSERTKDKLLERANKGMWNGGGLPFGYKIGPERNVHHDSPF